MRPFTTEHPLEKTIATRGESQHKDIMHLFFTKTGWVGYDQFGKLGIGPVSTKMSEIRKRIRPYGYTIANKMDQQRLKNGRNKKYSYFKLTTIIEDA